MVTEKKRSLGIANNELQRELKDVRVLPKAGKRETDIEELYDVHDKLEQ